MSTSVQSLEIQLEKLKKEAEEAQKRVEVCKDLLDAAKRKEGAAGQERIVRTRKIASPITTMPDQIAELLLNHGGLRSSELYELLKEHGRPNTSVNSINTQLSKYKERFKKDDEGRWHVVIKSPF